MGNLDGYSRLRWDKTLLNVRSVRARKFLNLVDVILQYGQKGFISGATVPKLELIIFQFTD